MRAFICLFLCVFLTACGFQLRNNVPLAPPLHQIYLETNDPYGSLARDIKQSLQTSHVQIVPIKEAAATILTIIQDTRSNILLSVNATQQTRQYNLHLVVEFEIKDNKGNVIVPSQILTQDKPITIQANEVLGSSNELNLFYQQMQREIVSNMMYRLSSIEMTAIINEHFATSKHPT